MNYYVIFSRYVTMGFHGFPHLTSPFINQPSFHLLIDNENSTSKRRVEVSLDRNACCFFYSLTSRLCQAKGFLTTAGGFDLNGRCYKLQKLIKSLVFFYSSFGSSFNSQTIMVQLITPGFKKMGRRWENGMWL